ncbi:SAM-dependent methyltransferase [Rhodoferax lacus]|uniref:SAM-dependent methyltransferase n=1 Tax=Rhodoferax lacus TaxID=2184758 RepID=A0A3E1R6I6_9BURK|nr:methyltransferase domain-containing protein [Rhodoferax lacus]RFO94954.1 SAM-dependent methyltransferase [Rhodoferax lacus]
MKKFLHVGCGPMDKTGLKGFAGADWQEVRFDIDKSVNPDIEGSLVDMSKVESSSVDAIYSAHNLEHIYPHEVPAALAEFCRVLKPDGMVVITCPDLQSVCAQVTNNRLLEPLYGSPSGPISAIDILYGHRGYMAQGNLYMAHKGGFTLDSLKDSLLTAGFAKAIGARRPLAFDVWMLAAKQELPDAQLQELAQAFLP